MLRRLKWITLLFGCFFACSCSYHPHRIDAEKTLQQKAEYYFKESERLYQAAIDEYLNALKAAKNPSEIYYELGRLYYRHADYAPAIDYLSRIKDEAASKLLAVCYYKAGKYTDALTLFTR